MTHFPVAQTCTAKINTGALQYIKWRFCNKPRGHEGAHYSKFGFVAAFPNMTGGITW